MTPASPERVLLRSWVPLFEEAQRTAERRVHELAPDDTAAWTVLGAGRRSAKGFPSRLWPGIVSIAMYLPDRFP